jgi:hypothetical protein
VLRSRPPWRRGEDLTECGKAVSAVAVVISRDAFVAKVRKQGQRRASLSTCMTCWSTAQNHPPWEVNPVASLVREASRLQWRSDPRRPDADLSFHDELMAITALIDAHPEEFAELLDGLSATVSLASRRTARRRHGNA